MNVGRRYTDEQLLEFLRTKQRELGRALTLADAEQWVREGGPSWKTVARHFSGWNRAQQLAGNPIRCRQTRFERGAVLAGILRMDRRLRKPATCEDYQRLCAELELPSHVTVRRHLGTWREVRAAVAAHAAEIRTPRVR